MREIIDIRLPEKWANDNLGSLGFRIGEITRKIEIETTDPQFLKLKSLIQEQRQIKPLGLSASVQRRYLAEEMESSELFHICSLAHFEPAGEECGTQFDESLACSICGAGRKQVSDLILDLRKVPKGKDIASTIADEWIVSQRLADLIVENGLTGVEPRPVHHVSHYNDEPIDLHKVPSGQKLLHLADEAGIPYLSWQFQVWLNQPERTPLFEQARIENVDNLKRQVCRQSKPMKKYYQFIVTSHPVTVAFPQTRFGIDPFDDDNEGAYRCPLGHVSGLNILSELSIVRQSWDGSDVAITREMMGVHRGLLRPRPLLVISPRFWKLLQENRISGCTVEVAHLV